VLGSKSCRECVVHPAGDRDHCGQCEGQADILGKESPWEQSEGVEAG
jgi:hypothetical protein